MAQLRIGFLVNSNGEVPAWYAETIVKVLQKGHAAFSLVRNNPVTGSRKSLSLRLFEAFENRWFRPTSDATKTVSISQWTTNENTFQLSDISLLDTTALKALKLDLIYTIDGDEKEWRILSQMALYGLWRVSFGRYRSAGAAPTGFWEVMDNEPVSGADLLVYKEDKIVTAYKGSTLTVPYSVKNNFQSLAWKASSFLPLRLTALEAEPDAFLSQLPGTDRLHPRPLPRNGKMVFLFLRNLLRYLKYKTGERKRRPFTLLYADTPFHLNTLLTTKFKALPLPDADTFYADPFVVQKEKRQYIFFEEMNEKKGKAHISLLTIDRDKKWSNPLVVLEQAYHLSYPFVFEHEGYYYMVPETAANGTIELYQAASFPTGWQFVKNLMTGVELVDATFHFENGKWWLFASGANHPAVSTNDQLFLYYADDLFSSSWTPHPQNPVATQAANCRPAGRIFRDGSRLYRPAQNNASFQYGYGLKLNEITVLTETAYEEREVLSVDPKSFGLEACHHIDFSSSFIVIDGILPTS